MRNVCVYKANFNLSNAKLVNSASSIWLCELKQPDTIIHLAFNTTNTNDKKVKSCFHWSFSQL